jgi:hypothetical protein
MKKIKKDITVYCVDCRKKLNKTAYYKKNKRCNKCAAKLRLQNQNGNYKDGRCLKQYYCLDCKKKINYCTYLYGKKRCRHCCKKHLALSNHHIDLRENSKRTIKLTDKKHSQLHRLAYNYVVELGLVNKYIKWFDKKYGLNEKTTKIREEEKC